MGGCSCEDDYEFINPRTVVLVGKTGNGKSATGNSILGMKVLLSKRSSSGVTVSSELHATTLEDGQMLKVIDTPGLFDSSLDFEFIGKEIVKCINMAQDGVDAFLFVVSALNRFSEEEEAAISSLKTLFGTKVYDYMIVVFTGGDQLEDDYQTLEDFLCDSSEALKETLRLCGNRYMLFDNKTKNESKRSNQVKELLLLVNNVSTMNGGKPYTNEIFTEMKNQMKEHKEQEITVDDARFKHVYEMIESKFRETTLKLEQQLVEERAKAEKKAKAAKKKQDEDKQKLKQKLEKKNKELQQKKVEKPQMKEEHEACAQAEKKGNVAKKKPDEMKELPRKEDCVSAEKNAKAAKKKLDEVKELPKKEDCVNAEKKLKPAKKNLDDEIKMLKEKLQKAEKKNKQKDEELRRKEAHWRQREEDLRRAGFGCSIM